MDSSYNGLKDKLEKMLLEESYDKTEVLKLSQELDKYVLNYYKNTALPKKDFHNFSIYHYSVS